MKVLLHVCCGPCLTAFHDYFKQKNIKYSGFFYNPNIHPYAEFEKRMKTLKIFADERNIDVIYNPEFHQVKWETDLKDFTQKDRCEYCYRRRILKTAETAQKKGFTHFTTTLLISPYQDHELIKSIGYEAADKYNIELYYSDFRKMFREGQKKARETNLYRQKYCGCIYSYNESKFKDKISWEQPGE